MSAGHFFLRVEHEEWGFLSSLDRDFAVPFDGAIVSDRYLAPYPDRHPRHGERPDRLLEELSGLRVSWLLDPDTARLGHDLAQQRIRPRAANSPIALASPLPLRPSIATPSGEAEALVDAAATVQLSSDHFASPYLEVSGADDPRFEANLRLLELSRQRAGDRRVVAFLQTMMRHVRDGSAAQAASALAAGGAELIVTKIRRFSAESADTEDVLAYASLINSIRASGAECLPDPVGRLGPALVACGAEGFSAGAFHFRALPDDLCPAGGGGNLTPLSWEVPGRFTSRPRGAPASGGDEQVRCSYPRCPAPTGDEDETAIRTHNLHELQRLGRLAGGQGLGFTATLRRSGDDYAVGWAAALERLQALAA